MSRHAFMIMAHDDFGVLEKLITRLDHPDNDIYVHIDRKAAGYDPARVMRLTRHSRVHVTRRMDVRWGDYSQIACELLLLRAATRKAHRYYHLVSGSDLPLVRPAELHRFFAERDGTEFVHFVTDPDLVFIPRIAQHHLFTRHRRITSNPKVWDTLGRVDDITTAVQRRLGVDRLRRSPLTPRYGSGWFSITENLARYVLENEPWIRRTFRRSLCGDELFVQTLAFNSPFRERLCAAPPGEDYLASARKIDWTRGGPYVWRLEDLDELVAAAQQGYLFARKFREDVDREVVEAVFTMTA